MHHLLLIFPSLLGLTCDFTHHLADIAAQFISPLPPLPASFLLPSCTEVRCPFKSTLSKTILFWLLIIPSYFGN
jgi:hypothetical protein